MESKSPKEIQVEEKITHWVTNLVQQRVCWSCMQELREKK